MAELRRMRPLLGTFVEVGARGREAGAGIAAAFASVERAQALWSFQDAGSELSRLNSAPGRRVPLQPDSVRLLRIAQALMRRSAGAFDCTIGGALVLGGTLPDHGGPPPLPRGHADDLEIGAGWARLRRPVRLSLDGVAKGYAVDLAIRALRRAGVGAGWVNAGGDLRVFGAIALPVQQRRFDGRAAPLGALRDAALASSRTSTQDRLTDAGPAFPGRIVAPAGQPLPSGVWTVLARSAWRADALTKVAAVTPAPRRGALVRQLGGCLVGVAGEGGAA
jgi:thiamine biosynthesis lipoprotein